MPDAQRNCPRCGFILDPFDTECRRCASPYYDPALTPRTPGQEITPQSGQPDAEPAGYTPAPGAQRCSHCGAITADWVPHCPNCGSAMPHPAPPPTGFVQSQSLGEGWPPPLPGTIAPPSVALLTRNAVGDSVLGFVTAIVGLIATVFTFGIGIALAIGLYFTYRRRYPVFGRGMLYGFAAVLFLVMAPCLFCLSSIFLPHLFPVGHRLWP